MNTSNEIRTPEMDAFERDTIACIPEELHQLQAYARKGRALEIRLRAAEVRRLQSPVGEPVAWKCRKCGALRDVGFHVENVEAHHDASVVARDWPKKCDGVFAPLFTRPTPPKEAAQ